MTDYPSPNMYVGRLKRPRLIVIHTMQCPPTDSATRGSMAYLQRPSVQASCHWGIGPTLTLSGVPEGNTAWAAPGANADGIQIEQAGYATKLNPNGSVRTQGTDYTTGDGALIVARTARLVADIAHRHSIPIRHLTDAQLAAGEAGIIGHIQATHVYGGTHWDPGDTYPWDTMIHLATGEATTPTTPPKPKGWLEMATVSELKLAMRAAMTILVKCTGSDTVWQVNLLDATKRKVPNVKQFDYLRAVGLPFSDGQDPAVLEGFREVK